MIQTEMLWNEYHEKLAAFIHSRVDDGAAEDILQDVFVKIHTHINTLEEDTKLDARIYQITRNTIIDHYRSRKMTEVLPDFLEQASTSETDLIKENLATCLESMIRELPEKYRQAVQLSELENNSQKQVAEIQGISLSGAKSRVQRGRVLLKGLLYACCDFEINKRNELISYQEKSKACKPC